MIVPCILVFIKDIHNIRLKTFLNALPRSCPPPPSVLEVSIVEEEEASLLLFPSSLREFDRSGRGGGEKKD